MADEVKLLDGETFKFLIPLAKATEDDEGKLYVEGIASDTGLDLMGERISEKGQASMAKWAKKGTVVLGGEANHWEIAFDDDLGKVVDGSVNDAEEFYIKSLLDSDNPRAVGLHTSLKKGKQLGLSVFGRITEFSQDDDGVPTIDGVALSRVMVTPSPANPRTWLESVAKSLPAQAAETGGDEVPEPDPALEDPVHEIPEDAAKAWDGSASNYESTEAYCAACLIDVNAAAGRDEKAQSHCKLPTKAPGSDSHDFEGIKAAAGGRGITQVKKPDDVPDDAWEKALKAAANTIIKEYNANDDTAPASVYEIAGKEPPEEAGKSEEVEEPTEELAPAEIAKDEAPEGEIPVEEPTDPEQEPVDPEAAVTVSKETAKTFGETVAPVIQAALGQGNDGGDQDTKVDQVAKDGGGLTLRQVVKGLFQERLQQHTEAMESYAPLREEIDRVRDIDQLVGLLWDVVYGLDWAEYDGTLTGDEAAALLRESIDEFKAEVAAKALVADDQGAALAAGADEEEPGAATEVVSEGEPPEGVAGEVETPVLVEKDKGEEQPEEPSPETVEEEVPMSAQTGKSIREIAETFAEEEIKERLGAAAPVAEPIPTHPAAQVAVMFTEAVKSVIADEALTPDQRRQAVALAMASTMDKMEQVMPAAPADDGLEDAPAWARALIGKVNALETAVAGVNVSAGSVEKDTLPENADRPTLPERKSVAPDITASTVIKQPQTLRQIALQLMTGLDEEALRLP